MQLLIYLSTFSLAIPLILLILTKSFRYEKLKWFGVFILAGVVTEIVIRIFITFHINSWIISHFWFPYEFAALSLFLLNSVRKKSKVVYILLAFLIAIDLYIHLFLEFHVPIATYGLLLSASVLICISLFVLFRLTYRNPHMNLFSDYRFYITIGVFIYQLGIISLTIYFTFFILPLWLHSLSNMVANILYGVAFYVNYRKRRNLHV